MTDRIEAQIERFAPGFRDLILARHTMPPAALERYNANYIGGDINGGIQDWAQLFTRPCRPMDAVVHSRARPVPLLVFHTPWRRRAWPVRVLCGTGRPQSDAWPSVGFNPRMTGINRHTCIAQKTDQRHVVRGSQFHSQ